MFRERSCELKCGNELASEVDLPGVACLMARRSFQQLQQGQAGERVFGVGRRGRARQLFRRELGEESAETQVRGLLVLQLLAEVLIAGREWREHLHLASGDLLQRVHVALGVEVQQYVAHRPAGAEERLLGLQTLQRLEQDFVSLVEALQSSVAAAECGLSFFRGQLRLRCLTRLGAVARETLHCGGLYPAGRTAAMLQSDRMASQTGNRDKLAGAMVSATRLRRMLGLLGADSRFEDSSSLYLAPGESPDPVAMAATGWAAHVAEPGGAALANGCGLVGLRSGSRGTVAGPSFPADRDLSFHGLG